MSRARRGVLSSALVILAVVGSACTGGSSTDSSQPSVRPAATNEYCPDLIGLACPRQVAAVAIPLSGASFALVYASDRVPGRTAAAAPDARPLGLGGWGLDVLHSYDPTDHVLAQGDGQRRTVEAIPVDDGLAVGSADGDEVYVFDRAGRQLRTEDALTGVVRYAFAWGASGLASITEPGSRISRIYRDDNGQPTAIVTASGYRTRLGTQNGWLAAIADPAGHLTSLVTTRSGLLTSLTNASGQTESWDYDSDGRLTAQTSPTGERTTYTRTPRNDGFAVHTTTPEGRETADTIHVSDGVWTLDHRDPTGIVTTTRATDTTRTITSPDGPKIQLTLAPDPRWKLTAPVVTSTVTTHDGRTSTATERRDRHSRAWDIDGATWETTHNADARTATMTDPVGQTASATYDETGLPVRTESDGQTTTYQYHDGRLTSVTTGDRTWRYNYDPDTVTTTDPLGQTTRTQYDAAGRPIAITTPDGRTTRVDRDELGNVVATAPPGRDATAASYRPDGQVEAVTAPAGSSGLQFTGFDYDADGLLTSAEAADGSGVDYGRDQTGRIVDIDAGGSSWQIGYDDAGLPTTVRGDADLRRTFSDGVLTGEEWTTPVSAHVQRTLDPLGRSTALAVGQEETPYQYDAAGRPIRMGELKIRYDSAGRIAQERIGALTRSHTYNDFGELTGTTVTIRGTVSYRLQLRRDRLGRVTARTETVDGRTDTTAFRYDAAGRLVAAGADRYGYDDAGNLIADGTTRLTYDGRDALTRRGDTTYRYDAAGRLAKAGDTAYRYDQLGNLLAVGDDIRYAFDGAGRRVGKLVDGRLEQGFAYQDDLRPIAEFDGTGQIVARFGYGPGQSITPSYLQRDGATYLVATDDVGTPRALIDATNGRVVERIDTDAWGRTDRASTLLPFGFAGGIADPDTGLLHFGARDYDPTTTRWTAPDPLGAASGDPNLYRYAGGDPVNAVDLDGLAPTSPPIINYGGQIAVCFFAGCWTEELGYVGTPGAGGFYHSSGPGTTVGPGAFAPIGGGAKVVWGTTTELTPAETAAGRLGNFGGPGTSRDVGWDWFSGGRHKGYNDQGEQTTEGTHGSVGPGTDWGLSTGNTNTEVFCLSCAFDTGPQTDSPDDGKNGQGISPPSKSSSPSKPSSPSSPSKSGKSGPSSFLDPHLTTASGVTYDFQAAGEFTALRSDRGDLVVQVRQEPLDARRVFTVNTAVAVSVHGDRVTFDRDGTVRVEGRRTALTGRLDLPRGGTLVAQDESTCLVRWRDGSFVRVELRGQWINLHTSLSTDRIGTLHGVLGPNPAEPTNRLETKDGRMLSAAALKDHDTLYRIFGDSWRITQAESLFDYPPGKTTASYVDRSVPDPDAPQVSAKERAAAQRICLRQRVPKEHLAGCIFDVSQTGNAAYAIATAQTLAGFRPTLQVGEVLFGSGQPTPPKPSKKPSPSTSTTTADIGAVRGSVDAPNQIKSHRIAGHRGDVVYLRASTPCEEDTFAWQIRRPDDSIIGGILDICSDIGRVSFESDGDYTVDIWAQDDKATGSYTFEIIQSRADRVRDVVVGDRITGSIDRPGAMDVYRITARRGQAVRLLAEAGCRDGRLQWVVEEPDGGTGGIPDICWDIDPLTFEIDGVYLIRVQGLGDATGEYGFRIRPS